MNARDYLDKIYFGDVALGIGTSKDRVKPPKSRMLLSELLDDFYQAKSKEEAEERYWDTINWTKIHNMEYPGNLAQALHMASGRLAAFGKDES